MRQFIISAVVSAIAVTAGIIGSTQSVNASTFNGKSNWGRCAFNYVQAEPKAMDCYFKFIKGIEKFQLVWDDGKSDVFTEVADGYVDATGTFWSAGTWTNPDNDEFYLVLTSTKGTVIAANLT